MKNKWRKAAAIGFGVLLLCGLLCGCGKTEEAPTFIRGMDASSVLVEENSGVVYYNFDGKEQDVFQTMAEAGVNYIRLRVWNDPYDSEGHGYGGGNNDLATAVQLGKRATEYGMKVCVDFHYSDFWADPKRQHAPKAWRGMDVSEKSDALYQYTKESLITLLDEGVDVGMVQVGNEINNGMSGVQRVEGVMELLTAGCKAVREVSDETKRDMQIVLHYTNLSNYDQLRGIASNLNRYDVDYDIFGISYYPFWDGTNEDLANLTAMMRDDYGKDVAVMETSYAYTTKDGDGTANSFDGVHGLVEGYPASVEGQEAMILDVAQAAKDAGAIGLFYWEGTWIPVGSSKSSNEKIWEEYGSGWASSYAAEYDPEDAGKYYGGCSWENQAMFDFSGMPLESLKVFQKME